MRAATDNIRRNRRPTKKTAHECHANVCAASDWSERSHALYEMSMNQHLKVER